MGIRGGSVLVPWRPAFWNAAEVVRSRRFSTPPFTPYLKSACEAAFLTGASLLEAGERKGFDPGNPLCMYVGARTPFGRGWLWFWSVVHSNSPLRPAAVDREGGQSERHRVSPPHARSWLCPHLPIDTHCTHVRAGLLLLRASVPRPRLAAPFPPCCLQHVPTARARRSRAPIYKQPGGRVGKN